MSADTYNYCFARLFWNKLRSQSRSSSPDSCNHSLLYSPNRKLDDRLFQYWRKVNILKRNEEETCLKGIRVSQVGAYESWNLLLFDSMVYETINSELTSLGGNTPSETSRWAAISLGWSSFFTLEFLLQVLTLMHHSVTLFVNQLDAKRLPGQAQI